VACKKWHASYAGGWGEDEHAAYRLALRGAADPIDAAFVECAETVFGSMYPHLADERLT
jgi:hypothetical protein